MNDNVNHLLRAAIIARAAFPPVSTHIFAKIVDPGLRYRMAAYDAIHTPMRGVIVDTES